MMAQPSLEVPLQVFHNILAYNFFYVHFVTKGFNFFEISFEKGFFWYP
jgi:hypothetical protein